MRRLLALSLLFACTCLRAAEISVNADPLAHLRPGHPRLLLTDEQLATAVAAAKTDPLRAQLHARIIAAAEAELTSAPIKHVLIGPRLLDKSRTCIARVLTCAMAFRLTGDERFLARAKTEMLTAAEFPDWNPSHFLDVAEMSFALAIGYDWLHAKLSPEDRATIKAALLKHGLALAPNAYAPGGATDSRVKRWVTAHHNWNQVCNGGLLAAALALAEDEPALARLVVKGVLQSLPLAMEGYAPDGAYPEGPGYWTYGTTYNVIAIAELESALGSDFGLTSSPAFLPSALFRTYAESPSGLLFNYADGDPTHSKSAAPTWLALKNGSASDVALDFSRALLQTELLRKRTDRENDRFFALHAIWFPEEKPNRPERAERVEGLDVRFRGAAEIALFRSAWHDPRALFVGFKAGRNDVNHAHLDLGSFVLDADGVRWAHDLGTDDYNLPGYFDTKGGFSAPRWRYYRLNNHSHNTVTPGDALQDSQAVAPIVAFGSTPQRALAVADLTGAYPGAAQKILRGIALLDRARVLVQDDLAGVKPATTITSRVLTSANVTLATDRRVATFVEKGRTLRAEILAPAGAKFSVSPARPTSAVEKQNEGFSALTAEYSSAGADVRLAILFTPVGDHWPAALPAPALTPLADWK